MSIHEYHLRLLSITTVTQSILQDFLVNASEELLAHSPHLAKPNISAVSTILSPYIKIFEKDPILKIPNNKGKVFDVKGTGIALKNPNISTFDVSMVCAILKRIPDFNTYNPDKANRCVNSCLQKCCQLCNHKKVDCGNCSVSFTECRFKKNLCCLTCQICGFCQGRNPTCDVFELKKNLDIIRRTRNIAAHGNRNEFIKLEKNGTPLEDFPKNNTWLGLSAGISNAVFGILSYMGNPQNFPSSNKIITLKQTSDYEIEMKIACEGSAIIVERNFNGAVFKLVSQMQESNEELEHLTDFLKNCIEKKLIDIDVMLTSHMDNFTKFDEQNKERYKEIERVLKANQKLLETLNEKHVIDIEAVKGDIKTQKMDHIKINERIKGTEANVTKLMSDHFKIIEIIEGFKTDIQSQTQELVIVKEWIDVTEKDIDAQKFEQLKIKEQVDVTEAQLVAQKNDQVKVDERIEADISTIKDKIGLSNAKMDQGLSINQVSIIAELIKDDGSSHSFQMRESNWYLSCHHDKIDQPEVLINNFDRNLYAPGDKKILKSYQCGNTIYDNEAGYAKYLSDKFDEQFGKDLIEQPWLLTNLHEDCVENRNFYQLCRDVHSFSQNKKYSFLLIDVSIEDNLKNLGFDINKVKEKLNVLDTEDSAHRVILYIGEADVLLNIRYVDSNGKKNISDAVRKGQNDTKLFCALHKDVLRKTSISFVSMVVANTSKKQLLNIITCSECVSKNLIVSSSRLYTSLESIVSMRMEEKINNSSSASTVRFFIELASRLWSTLCIRDVHLPNLCTDRDSALERIYLNGAQRRFLHSKKKHAILRGGYGSGKSVLAQEKFKYLIQNATGTQDIFYLCFNDETLFKGVLKEQISITVNHQLRSEQISIMNSEEYGKQFGLLPPVMFSEILQDINERYKKAPNKPHVIADEFDSNNLTSNEADSINNILPEFKDSYVLLIPQSLETVRKKINSQLLRNQEEKYAGQEFKRTGMAITMLDSIMRNTTRINELSQVTIRELERHKSKIYVSDTPVPIESDANSAHLGNVEHSFKTANKLKSRRSFNDVAKTYDVKPNVAINHIANKPMSNKDKNSVDNDNMDESNTDVDHIKVDLQKSPNINSHKEQQFRIDSNSIPVNFYHVLKQMNTCIEKSSSRSIESQFRFPGKGKHGHKVIGKMPLLINPFRNIEIDYDTMNKTEMKMRLLFALQNILNISEKSKGMAVIVFEPIEAQLFHAIFLSMDIDTIVYTPAISTGLTQIRTDDIVNKLKDHVLVTDHIGARGLEFKHLLVTVNSNEIFLYQHLVEAFTRCLYELSFIVFDIGVKEKGTFSSGNILKLWEKNNLVQKYEIEVCDIHEEDSEYLDLYCKKMNRCYHIHTWHKDLRPATTIDYIKRVSESNEQLRVQYNKLLSHAYLEEEVTQKQAEQVLSKECTRRGYKTYKDIILGNDKEIVDMFLRTKDMTYITNYRDVDGNSLLELAFLHYCENSIRAIINFRLECSLSYEKLITQNDKQVIDLLLRFMKNPILDYRDINGNSMMHIALENGWTNFIRAMRYYGLLFDNIRNNDNKSPIDLALDSGNKSINDLLKVNIEIESMIKEYDDASNKSDHLKDLISNDTRDELKVLLSNRNLTREHEWTLLHYAARYNNVYLFELFIQFGCHVVVKNKQHGDTVLHYAVRNGSKDVINCIVDRYPLIVDVKNKQQGDTALHYAASIGSEKVMKIILDKYPQLGGVKNTNGDTILHVAARNGKSEAVKFILEKCPHIVDVTNNKGNSAYNVARHTNKRNVISEMNAWYKK